MKLTTQIKRQVVDALLADMAARGMTQIEYARMIKGTLNIPFDKAALSQIKKEDSYSVIRDTSWLRLARHFGAFDKRAWRKADTGTFITVTAQLELCQANGMLRVLCDSAGIGKTFAAINYANEHKGSVIYIDCSQHPTKSEFITAFAAMFGLEKNGTYTQLWREATDELLLLESPLLILDEFGDAPDSVVTLLKSLYNKADMGDYLAVGIYMIGADNLRKKLMDGRKRKKQSFAEFWSRFDNAIETLDFAYDMATRSQQVREEVEMIVDANLPAELAEKRGEIVDKVAKTMGVRAVRGAINLENAIHKLITA